MERDPLEIADECSHQAIKAAQRGQYDLAGLLNEAGDQIYELVEEIDGWERMDELGITRQDIAETMPPEGMY